MSRNAVIEEVSDEEFDDDTDLPLPPLPNTGSHGPLLQQLNEPQTPTRGPPTSRPSQLSSEGETSASGEKVTIDPVTGKKTVWVEDSSPYKKWTSLYPIYFDAKRPYGGSERRISREKCVWWPLSSDIVDACKFLGLKTLHEPSKKHPRDWENPGRVKVCFKEDGHLQNPRLTTKKQLLEAIGSHIQQLNPDLVPGSTSGEIPISVPTREVKPSSKKDKAKTTAASRTAPTPMRKTRSQLPQPPPSSTRVSPYSPAQEANILIETVKAGMNAPAPGEGIAGNPMLAGGKGKRKVIRVRQ